MALARVLDLESTEQALSVRGKRRFSCGAHGRGQALRRFRQARPGTELGAVHQSRGWYHQLSRSQKAS